MGGYDLFYSRKKDDGTWSKPKNLGYPINTQADEMVIIVNAKGDKAFISSDKLGGKGREGCRKDTLADFERGRG